MLRSLWCAPLLVSGKRRSSGRRFRRRHGGDGGRRSQARNGDGEDVGGLAGATQFTSSWPSTRDPPSSMGCCGALQSRSRTPYFARYTWRSASSEVVAPKR